MTPTKTDSTNVDLTRLNRANRRQMFNGKGKMLGRNLPYMKAVHGSIQNYNELRAKEMEEESKDK